MSEAAAMSIGTATFFLECSTELSLVFDVIVVGMCGLAVVGVTRGGSG